jgi:hypothetical protein
MKLINGGDFPLIALAVVVVAGALYAQEHNAKESHSATSVPEVFCSHMKTGQLCSGNASMFKLSDSQKQQYREVLSSYNKAVDAAQKQFLADLKDKVHLSETELALAESWFAQGLNPEINKILAARAEKHASNTH